MAKYAAEFNDTISTTTSIGTWVADATRPRRLKFLSVRLGVTTTPTDHGAQFLMDRVTAAGTNTAVTPRPLDPADAATESDAGENHSAEPTYSTQPMISEGFHFRAGLVWFAPPGCEPITPATASNGMGMKTPVITSGTPDVYVVVIAEEQ